MEATLRPTPDDLEWLLAAAALKPMRRSELIRSLLAAATPLQLRGMLANQDVLGKTLAALNTANASDADLLSRIAYNVTMPPLSYVGLVVNLLPYLKDRIGTELIGKATELALTGEPDEVSFSTLDRLLTAAGDDLNGERMMRVGLQPGVSQASASRNLLAFDRAPAAARRSLLTGIEEMAVALTDRQHLDISTEAAEAAARMLWDARSGIANGFVRASAILLPFALVDRRETASPLIAAAFPPVYWELSKDSGFDLLRYIFVFLDWDKCKSARRRLIDSFAHSEWRISDIATAAVRAGDPVRILGRVARERGGETVLRDLMADLTQVPDEVRQPVRAALKELGLS